MSFINEIKSYGQGFISLVFPNLCAACGNALFRNEKIICTGCLADLPKTGFHRDMDNEVARMFWGRVPIVYATAFMYFAKGSRYQRILHEIKYNGQQNTGFEMGRMFGNDLKNSPFASVDLVHPVPLHAAKLKSRGYNQSERIAAGMCTALHIPIVTDAIARSRDTPTQTRRSRYERWENVSDMFICQKPGLLAHKHILLVDDVITTGATLEACAASLAGAEDVRISLASLAFARLQA